MSVLSDVDIARELGYGELDVSPVNLEEQLQPASLDIRLGDKIYKVSSDEVINGDTHCFKPGEFYLGHSMEYIDMPNDICAQLTGRSTIGRKGLLVHVTAGWVDNCFSGELTFELYNLSSEKVEIPVGSRIAQLVFFRTNRAKNGYDGQYSKQTGITKSGDV